MRKYNNLFKNFIYTRILFTLKVNIVHLQRNIIDYGNNNVFT